MKRCFPITIIALALTGLLTQSTMAADTWADISKKIAAQGAKAKSVSWKMKTTMDQSGEGFSMKSETNMSFEYVNDGPKSKFHTETHMKGSTKYTGGEQKLDSSTISVCDGEYVYSYSDSQGQKQASKEKVNAQNAPPYDPEKSIKDTEKMYSVRVLPDATVDGHACWVVELTPKDPQMKAVAGKTICSYDKETGLGIKVISHDPKGNPMSTTTMTDIKVNPSIPADHFKFTPPAGVKVEEKKS